MKKNILFLMIMCVATSANAQYKTDVEHDGLKGKVSSIKTVICEVVEKNGRAVKDDCFSNTVNKYNYSGNRTEHNEYRKDGSLRTRTVYEYNNRGHKIKGRDEYWDDNKISRAYTTFYTTDTNGNVLEEDSRDENGDLRSRAIYKYDYRGYKTEMQYYSRNDGEPLSLSFKYTWQYDIKGNCIETKRFYSDELEVKQKDRYDSNGTHIELKHYNSAGTLEYTDTFKHMFDVQNNWIERICYLNGEIKYITTREINYYK